MKNFFIYLIIVLIFSQQLAQSQEIKDKNVLIVWGGWEGHNPKLFSDIVEIVFLIPCCNGTFPDTTDIPKISIEGSWSANKIATASSDPVSASIINFFKLVHRCNS